MTTVQWMWGDASIVGHSVAQMNPLRWSARKTFPESIAELQQIQRSEPGQRPLVLRITDGQRASSQHFANVYDAIARLGELSGIALPAPGDAASPGGASYGVTQSVLTASVLSAPMSASILSQDGPSPRSAAGSPKLGLGDAPRTHLGASVSPSPSGSFVEAVSTQPDATLRTDDQPATTWLAGMLEKRAQWRKEWSYRFFVVQKDRIDYYLTPPATLGENPAEARRGFVRVVEARAAEDIDRPYCISVGGELLSCKSREEQQRWLEAIAKVAATLPTPQRSRTASMAESNLSGIHPASLMVLPPQGETTKVAWRERSSAILSRSDSAISVLFLEAGDFNLETSPSHAKTGCTATGALALCRLTLFDAGSCEMSFPVRLLNTQGDDPEIGAWELSVKVHSNKLADAASKQEQFPVIACLCAAAALYIGGSPRAAALAVVLLALALFVHTRRRQGMPQRCIIFSIEALTDKGAAEPEPLPPLTETPKWLGRWQLDKTCSEPYEPVLADLGVNYLIRKAADAATSVMTITTSEAHVNIHLKIFVSVEDCIPLDGSFALKPVPPGSPMKGECKVRLTKANTNEFEMLTIFPPGHGELRDTLVVAEDGLSFTRIVVRGKLSVTRVFRRVADGQ